MQGRAPQLNSIHSASPHSKLLLFAVVLAFVPAIDSQLSCNEFLSGDASNRIVITKKVLESTNKDVQPLIECLDDGGQLELDMPVLQVANVLKIDRNIEISTADSKSVTEVQCPEGRRFLEVGRGAVHLSKAATVEMDDVSFMGNINKEGPGAVSMEESSKLVAKNSFFGYNSGGKNGGALASKDASTINLSKTTFWRNTAKKRGGAIFVKATLSESKLFFSEMKFVENESLAAEGGGIVMLGRVVSVITEFTEFRSNVAGYEGGALFLKDGANLSVSQGVFLENTSHRGGGGAIYAENVDFPESTISLETSFFRGNNAMDFFGGGGAVRLDGQGVRCTISKNCLFQENVASFDGGALYVVDGPDVTIKDAVFKKNIAKSAGGAMSFLAAEQQSSANAGSAIVLTVFRTKFLENIAVGHRGGGAVFLSGIRANANFTDNCLFAENENANGDGAGGALRIIDGPTINVENSVFLENYAANKGGAIFTQRDAKQTLTRVTFEGNSAREGGAIYTELDVDMFISGCTFTANTAEDDGGGICAVNFVKIPDERMEIMISDTTFTRHQVGDLICGDSGHSTEVANGGAVLLRGEGINVKIQNTTFRENVANQGGGLALDGVGNAEITEQTSFDGNIALQGGGMSIQPAGKARDSVVLQNVQIRANRAERGGGVIATSKQGSDALSIIPDSQTDWVISLDEVSFEKNLASEEGGALYVSSLPVSCLYCNFSGNQIMFLERDKSMVKENRGGAVSLVRSSLFGSFFTEYVRNTVWNGKGGAVSAYDSQFLGETSNFSGNQADYGGAMAIFASSRTVFPSKDQVASCNFCQFSNNAAKWAGGAIHYIQEPFHSFGQDDIRSNICKKAEFCKNPLGLFEVMLLCKGKSDQQARLANRNFLLDQATFVDNEGGDAGGAIFTNAPKAMKLCCGQCPEEPPVGGLLELGKEGCQSFEGNSINKGGYGPVFATVPNDMRVTPDALYAQSSDSNLNTELAVTIVDWFNQAVRHATGLVTLNGINGLTLSGKVEGIVNPKANAVVFSDGTLIDAPRLGETYEIEVKVDPKTITTLATELETKRVKVDIRGCQPGEKIEAIKDGAVKKCRQCEAGTFSFKRDSEECGNCPLWANCRGNGSSATPRDGHWHSTSQSLQFLPCLWRDACIYMNRTNELTNASREAHAQERILQSQKEYPQCIEGYHGPLCGACDDGYARVRSVECLPCGSHPITVLLLVLIFLWSLIVAGLFIRSILMLVDKLIARQRVATSGSRQSMAALAPSVSNRHADTEVSLREATLPGAQVTVSEIGVEMTEQNSDNPTDPQVNEESRSGLGLKAESQQLHDMETATRQEVGPTAPSEASSDEVVIPFANPVTEVMKILINFFQITALSLSVNADWTDALKDMLSITGVAFSFSDSSRSSLFSVDCLMSATKTPRSIKRMILNVASPFIIVGVFVLFWALKCFTVNVPDRSAYLSHRIRTSILGVIYIFYVSTTNNLIRILQCLNVDDTEGEQYSSQTNPNTGQYWGEDTDVVCFEGSHLMIVLLLVVPLLLSISLGFPAGLWFVLWKNRLLLEDEGFLTTYGFLYKSYNESHHYWEILVMLRKVAVVTVVVFSYGLGPNLQAILAVGILVVALGLHLSYQPFTTEFPRLNKLETLSLSTSTLVFGAIVVLNDKLTTDGIRVFVSVLAGTAVVWTVGHGLWELMLSTSDYVNHKLVELGIVGHGDLKEDAKELVVHYVNLFLEHKRSFEAKLRAATGQWLNKNSPVSKSRQKSKSKSKREG